MVGTSIEEKEEFTKQLYQISNFLGVKKISYLRRLILNKYKNYTSFFIPKKKGTPRKIEEPSRDLKTIQRRILRQILSTKRISPYCHGFVEGRSIVTNSQLHVGKKIILKVDIKDFFPSIGFRTIKDLFVSFGFNDQVSRYLSELCTLEDHLPQGAPTSPALSNLVCRNLDKRLFYLAKKSNLEYSRYADDIIFSGRKIKRSIYKIVRQIIESEGFKINENKVFWVNNQRAQIITGVVVNSKSSFGKKRFKNLSAFIHNCTNKNLSEQKLRAINEKGVKIKNLKSYLYGSVAFLRSIDLIKARKLKDKLDSIPQERWDSHILNDEVNTKRDLYIEIIRLVRKLNDRFKTPLFKGRCEDYISVVNDFRSLEEFNIFCLDFGNFVDKIDTSHFGIPVDKEHPSLDNLKEWLNSCGYSGQNVIEVLYDIKKFSNNISRHKDLEPVSNKLMKYGESLSNPDFNRLTLTILKKVSLP